MTKMKITRRIRKLTQNVLFLTIAKQQFLHHLVIQINFNNIIINFKMQLKDLLSKDDLIYFFSIIGAFHTLTSLKSVNLENRLNQILPFSFNITHLVYLVSALIIALTLLKQFAILVKKETEQKHPMWDNDIGLILGTVLASSLLFASEKHVELCPQKRVYQLVLWFLIGRVASFVGHLLNRVEKASTWNTFGDGISFFTTLVAVGFACNFDSYLLL